MKKILVIKKIHEAGIQILNNRKDYSFEVVENLENDFKVVAEEIGIAETTRLPHVNSTKRAQRRHYSEYYTREAREKIAEIYADDIKMFGYKFGE